MTELITVASTEPGIPAPLFLACRNQYAVALFTDGVTYLLPPGTISGIVSRGFVGFYQFNVLVPNVGASDTVSITPFLPFP